MENNSGFGSSYVEDQLNNLRRVRGNRFVEDLTRAAQSGGNTWRIAEQFGVSKFLVGLLRDYHAKGPVERSVLRLAYLRAAVVLLAIILSACNYASTVVLYNRTTYPSSGGARVFADSSQIGRPYRIIGYVESKGGVWAAKEEMLDDMLHQAGRAGADGLIELQFYDRTGYNKNIGSYEKPAAKALMIRYVRTPKPTASTPESPE